MNTKTEQATPTQPAAKPPMGQKAIDMIRNTVRASMRYHTGTRNLQGMQTSVVRYLVPTPRGNFIPINNLGYRIGQTEPNLDVTREWVIPRAAVEAASHMGLTTDANGVIDLFVRGVAPWIDEFCYKPWSARACAICAIDIGQLFNESCRPQPRMFGSNSSVWAD